MDIKYRFSFIGLQKIFILWNNTFNSIYYILLELIPRVYRLSYCLWIVSSRSSFLASLQLVGKAPLQNVGIKLNDDFAKRLRKK